MLADGTEIDRKADVSLDDDSLMKIAEAARNPEKIASLSVEPLKTPVNEKEQPGIRNTKPVDTQMIDRLGEIDGMCASCGRGVEPGDQQQGWALVHAIERLEKSVRCLGFPLGWDLFVDGIKVSPLARFRTAVCSSCVATLREQAIKDAESQRQEREASRKESARLNAFFGVGAVLIAATCFFSASFFSTAEWVYWVGATFGVIGVVLLLSMFEFTEADDDEDEIVDQEIQAVQDNAILAAIGSSDSAEILRDDQPSEMAGANSRAMKTTLDIKDDLLIRVKKMARKTGRLLRAIVEDSLRVALEVAEEPRSTSWPITMSAIRTTCCSPHPSW